MTRDMLCDIPQDFLSCYTFFLILELENCDKHCLLGIWCSVRAVCQRLICGFSSAPLIPNCISCTAGTNPDERSQRIESFMQKYDALF